MKRTILAFLIIFVLSFQVFAGETVRVYDNKYQLKYIYDVESGRVYDTRYQLRYIVENNRIYDHKYQPTYMYDADAGTIHDYGYNLQYKIEGNTVAIKGASFGSMGDMASKGTGGGLISANTHGPCKFISPGSMDVKFEGVAALCRLNKFAIGL